MQSAIQSKEAAAAKRAAVRLMAPRLPAMQAKQALSAADLRDDSAVKPESVVSPTSPTDKMVYLQNKEKVMWFSILTSVLEYVLHRLIRSELANFLVLLTVTAC